MIRYVAAIFLGALLLFLVQPILGRLVLPWYGGTAMVWTTCLLFFQVLLLAGYGYAHWSLRLGRPHWQVALQCVLLAAAAASLPLALRESLEPQGTEHPTFSLLLLLGITAGLPFFVLATTGPTIQAWQARTHPGRSPYRLFAVSNGGSLAALALYPFAIEPLVGLRAQAALWSAAFLCYAGLMAWCGVGYARRFLRGGFEDPSLEARPGGAEPVPARPPRRLMLAWVGLAVGPSTLLVSTSQLMVHEVSSSPFLWVVPLSLYLLTFILCFENPRWYVRSMAMPLMFASSAFAVVVARAGLGASLPFQLLAYPLALFACAMVCHGELERLKPHRLHLTSFYLMVAAGGALGGFLVAVVAPMVFHGYHEYHLALLWCMLAGTVAALGVGERWRRRMVVPDGLLAVGFAGASAIVAASMTVPASGGAQWTLLHRERNVYGVLSVFEGEGRRSLVHGRTNHGYQALDPEMARVPILYYHAGSGVGAAFRALQERNRQDPRPVRVGLIGLGAGVMAAWSRPGDRFTFYEIDPAVERLARRYFTYIEDARGDVEVILGDARVQLERELRETGSRQFHLLFVDAFSSDAIPVHLLTRESLALYRRHLRPDGAIVFHVTNRFLDLRPVVRQLAEDAGMAAVLLEDDGGAGPLYDETTTVVLTEDRGLAGAVSRLGPAKPWPTEMVRVLWTDDYASLLRLVHWTFQLFR